VSHDEGYICSLGRRPVRVLVVCEWIADVVAATEVQRVRRVATNPQNRRERWGIAPVATKNTIVGNFFYGNDWDIRIEGAPSSDSGPGLVVFQTLFRSCGDMIQDILGTVVVCFLGVMGVYLIASPETFLAKLGRPATQKHVRATRFIGFVFLVSIAMGVVSWIRQPR
jgi:hypothetical protein